MKIYRTLWKLKGIISFQFLTLKLSAATVHARAILQTQKSRKNKSRSKFWAHEVPPWTLEHYDQTWGVNSLNTICYTELISHSIFSHVPITVTVPAAPNHHWSYCWLRYVLPCALHAAASRPGRRRRRRRRRRGRTHTDGLTNSPFSHSPACLLGTRRTSRGTHTKFLESPV